MTISLAATFIYASTNTIEINQLLQLVKTTPLDTMSLQQISNQVTAMMPSTPSILPMGQRPPLGQFAPPPVSMGQQQHGARKMNSIHDLPMIRLTTEDIHK